MIEVLPRSCSQKHRCKGTWQLVIPDELRCYERPRLVIRDEGILTAAHIWREIGPGARPRRHDLEPHPLKLVHILQCSAAEPHLPVTLGEAEGSVAVDIEAPRVTAALPEMAPAPHRPKGGKCSA